MNIFNALGMIVPITYVLQKWETIEENEASRYRTPSSQFGLHNAKCINVHMVKHISQISDLYTINTTNTACISIPLAGPGKVTTEEYKKVQKRAKATQLHLNRNVEKQADASST
ncbi:hypothetical protein GQX74_009720 [Glossina fuscipes]|nr:hypothetical protein GQX74_009720 [Glossina fuscipes]